MDTSIDLFAVHRFRFTLERRFQKPILVARIAFDIEHANSLRVRYINGSFEAIVRRVAFIGLHGHFDRKSPFARRVGA